MPVGFKPQVLWAEPHAQQPRSGEDAGARPSGRCAWVYLSGLGRRGVVGWPLWLRLGRPLSGAGGGPTLCCGDFCGAGAWT